VDRPALRAVGIGTAAVGILLWMGLAAAPILTVGFALLIVSIAAFVEPPRPAAVLLAWTWVAWGIGVAWVGAIEDGWVAWVVAMVVATGLGLLIFRARRSTAAELAAAVAEARALAVTDPLTGLANRAGLVMRAGPMVEAARRAGDAVHCLFLDVDGLKTVNDHAGHASGDEILVAVADALQEVTRGTDVVARIGGDEFVVVGPGTGTAPLDLERRVREHVRQVPPVDADLWDAAVTVGGALSPPWEHESLESLVQAADAAMYRRRALLRRVATSEAAE
jgi:diguanylate cyclase (GGDEF)-like protein